MSPRLFSFIGGDQGAWTVTAMLPVAGEGLARVARVSILSGEAVDPAATWCLRGVTSNERYVTREEKDQ